MTTYRVDCINKPNRLDPTSRISNLGGTYPYYWKKTEDDVIHGIQYMGDVYFTNVGEKVAILEVVQGPHRKYLRTAPDNSIVDNLLYLPECS